MITDAKESFFEEEIFGVAFEFNDVRKVRVRVEVEVVEDVIATADDIGV